MHLSTTNLVLKTSVGRLTNSVVWGAYPRKSVKLGAAGLLVVLQDWRPGWRCGSLVRTKTWSNRSQSLTVWAWRIRRNASPVTFQHKRQIEETGEGYLCTVLKNKHGFLYLLTHRDASQKLRAVKLYVYLSPTSGLQRHSTLLWRPQGVVIQYVSRKQTVCTTPAPEKKGCGERKRERDADRWADNETDRRVGRQIWVERMRQSPSASFATALTLTFFRGT